MSEETIVPIDILNPKKKKPKPTKKEEIEDTEGNYIDDSVASTTAGSFNVDPSQDYSHGNEVLEDVPKVDKPIF